MFGQVGEPIANCAQRSHQAFGCGSIGASRREWWSHGMLKTDIARSGTSTAGLLPQLGRYGLCQVGAWRCALRM